VERSLGKASLGRDREKGESTQAELWQGAGEGEHNKRSVKKSYQKSSAFIEGSMEMGGGVGPKQKMRVLRRGLSETCIYIGKGEVRHKGRR